MSTKLDTDWFEEFKLEMKFKRLNKIYHHRESMAKYIGDPIWIGLFVTEKYDFNDPNTFEINANTYGREPIPKKLPYTIRMDICWDCKLPITHIGVFQNSTGGYPGEVIRLADQKFTIDGDIFVFNNFRLDGIYY